MQETKINWTEHSWNPVSGCTKVSEECKHCLDPSTPILYADLTWRPIGDARVGDELLAFDEHSLDGQQRAFRTTRIKAVWASTRPRVRIVTRQSDIVTTGEHRWLVTNGGRTPWRDTNHLYRGNILRWLGDSESPKETSDYRRGYLAGMTMGDGTYRFDPSRARSEQPQPYWRVALIDHEAIGRLVSYLASFGIEAHSRPFTQNMSCVELRSMGKLALIDPLLTHDDQTTEFARGYVAGFFDSEGSFSAGNIRLCQKDPNVLARVTRYIARLGFACCLESNGTAEGGPINIIRVPGGIVDQMRFLSTIQPAIRRKLAPALDGAKLRSDLTEVILTEKAGTGDVVDIETESHTFFAAGVATHNCYAETLAENRRGTPAFPNGFDITLRPWKLGEPRKIKRGSLIFTNSTSDLFHEKIPDEYRDQVLDVIESTPHHRYQVLTKRPEIAARFAKRRALPRNIWLGVTVGHAKRVERIDILRSIDAHVRFISAEPLLTDLPKLDLRGIHWLISGGESGAHLSDAKVMARRGLVMRGEVGEPRWVPRLDRYGWIASLRDQCVAAGVAYWFKQWGGPRPESGGRVLEGRTWEELPTFIAGAMPDNYQHRAELKRDHVKAGKLQLPLVQ